VSRGAFHGVTAALRRAYADSGEEGECQRLRLARELARPARRPTLFILDEPTVGLHPTDVARLVDALDGLVAAGHSVLVVDHDPLLLGRCDRLVELVPGGGPDGGRVVAAGTPEQVAAGASPTAPSPATGPAWRHAGGVSDPAHTGSGVVAGDVDISDVVVRPRPDSGRSRRTDRGADEDGSCDRGRRAGQALR
jgi:hypothetical protein